ncbi:hypothetical protein [Streptomyces canus]|uniref:hypothetical protein n=1 Tax=Streptomyces canus TaxID=58343 RepID=UPI000526173B|nr:hypothetical protein [Streptomyces canus]
MAGVFDDDPTQEPMGQGLLKGELPAVLQEASVVVKAPVGTTLESIPSPRPPAGDGDLSELERETLEACKAGMNNLHNAFWVAGKSLETMAVGNLHRNEGFANFAEFVWTNWEISESQVYRLMDGWRIGESLSQLGHRPRESQVRELTDIKRTAGDEAAVAVYDAVARSDKRVTARLLARVARQLLPLSRDLNRAQIDALVREMLTPPRDAVSPASRPEQPVITDGEGDGVQTDVSLRDSPIGEPQGRRSDAGDAGGGSTDLERLAKAQALLREAAQALSKPVVRRALKEAPGAASSLLADIENDLNRIGRAAARRPE